MLFQNKGYFLEKYFPEILILQPEQCSKIRKSSAELYSLLSKIVHSVTSGQWAYMIS